MSLFTERSPFNCPRDTMPAGMPHADLNIPPDQQVRPVRWGVIDVETHDLIDSRIVQLGAALYEGREVRQVLEGLVNPGVPIAPDATKIHGITDAMVADKQTFEQAARNWLDVFRRHEWLWAVAYNGSNFDEKILDQHFAEAGIVGWVPRVLDLFIFIKWKLRHLDGLKLAQMCERYGIELKAHDAGSDAHATGELLIKLVEDGIVPDSIEAAFAEAERLGPLLEAEYTRWRYFLYEREDGVLRIGYGQYRGEALHLVPDWFIRKALKRDRDAGRPENWKMTPDVRRIFEERQRGLRHFAPAKWLPVQVGPTPCGQRVDFQRSELAQLPMTAAAIKRFFVRHDTPCSLIEVRRDENGVGALIILVPQHPSAQALQELADGLLIEITETTIMEWQIGDDSRPALDVEVQQYADGIDGSDAREGCIAGHPAPREPMSMQTVGTASAEQLAELDLNRVLTPVDEAALTRPIIAAAPACVELPLPGETDAQMAGRLYGEGSLIQRDVLDAEKSLASHIHVYDFATHRCVDCGRSEHDVNAASAFQPLWMFGTGPYGATPVKIDHVAEKLPRTVEWLVDAMRYYSIEGWKLMEIGRNTEGVGNLLIELPKNGPPRPSVFALGKGLQDLVYWQLVYRDSGEWAARPDALRIDVREPADNPNEFVVCMGGQKPGPTPEPAATGSAPEDRLKLPCFNCVHRLESKARVADYQRRHPEQSSGPPSGMVCDPAPLVECKFHSGYGQKDESKTECRDFAPMSEAWLMDSHKLIGWRRLLAGPGGKLNLLMPRDASDEAMEEAAIWARAISELPGITWVGIHRLKQPIERSWNLGDVPITGSFLGEPLRRYFWVAGKDRGGVQCEIERSEQGTGVLYVTLDFELNQGMLNLIADHLHGAVNRPLHRPRTLKEPKDSEWNTLFGKDPIDVLVKTTSSAGAASYMGKRLVCSTMRVQDDGSVIIDPPAEALVQPRELKPSEMLQAVPPPAGVTAQPLRWVLQCDRCGRESLGTQRRLHDKEGAVCGAYPSLDSPMCEGTLRLVSPELAVHAPLVLYRITRDDMPKTPPKLWAFLLASSQADALALLAPDGAGRYESSEIDNATAANIQLGALDETGKSTTVRLCDLRAAWEAQNLGSGILWTMAGGVSPLVKLLSAADAPQERPKEMSPAAYFAEHPAAVCNVCGRKTWEPLNVGAACKLPQPDTSICNGTFTREPVTVGTQEGKS